MLNFLPNIIFAPLAGVLADRGHRKRIMLVCELARAGLALSVACLLFLDSLPLWYLILCAFLVSSAETFFSTAFSAGFANLFDGEAEDMVNASALSSSGNNLVQIAGFACGGLVVAFMGFGLVYVVDALSFLVSALAVLAVRRRFESPSRPGPSAEVPGRARSSSYRKEFTEGLRYLVAKPLIVCLCVGGLVANLALAPVEMILSWGTTKVFAYPGSALGIAIAVLMLGVLGGNLAFPRFYRRVATTRLLVLGIGLVAVGFLAAGLPFHPLCFFGGLTLAGFAVSLCSGAVSALFNTEVDDGMRGRVGSLLNAGMNIASPLGIGMASLLLACLSMQLVLGILAAVVLAATFWLALSLRRAGRLPVLSGEAAADSPGPEA